MTALQLAIDASPQQGSRRPPGAAAEPAGHRGWRDYGGGPDSSKFVALDQINKSNVGQLRVAWTYPTSDILNYQVNGQQYLVVCATTGLTWGPKSREGGVWTQGDVGSGAKGGYIAFALPAPGAK